jgi:mRNA interferase RelE/StbE
MNTIFRESFWRDVKKVKDAKTSAQINAVIAAVEKAGTLSEVDGIRKMEGADNVFRIRSGRFRVCFFLVENVVEFVRCLPRKDSYRHFP